MAETFHYQSEAQGRNVKLQQSPKRKDYVELVVLDDEGQSLRVGISKPDALSLFAEFLENFSEELRTAYVPRE
ncbi:MAG: hypothetical protein F4X04_13950 [Holophagales bacterium]|nr:hypothetical protein [Holophagales bacterium]